MHTWVFDMYCAIWLDCKDVNAENGATCSAISECCILRSRWLTARWGQDTADKQRAQMIGRYWEPGLLNEIKNWVQRPWEQFMIGEMGNRVYGVKILLEVESESVRSIS